MNKESVHIRLESILFPKTLIFFKWQVDAAIRIPVRLGLVPLPLPARSCPGRPNRRAIPLFKRLIFTGMLLFGLFDGLSASAIQSVSIAWSPSTDTSTAGYVIYTSNSPTNFAGGINVGTNTTITISGLTEGTTNYFAVAGYNSANLVGALSTPISYLVPGALIMSHPAGTTAPTLDFPTAVGHYYVVEASTNLLTWTNIYQTPTATTNAWTSFQDPQASSFSHRFYRLLMH